MKKTYPIYLAGQFITSKKELPVVNPFDGAVWTTTYLASVDDLEEAIKKGLQVQGELKKLPSRIKSETLLHIAAQLKERKEEFAEAMARESAKPLFFARAEVDRAIATFTDGAEEAKRIYGEWMGLDRTPAGDNHEAIVRHFPIGLIAAIAPFNFPLNLVAHKLAPAIAAGCPIILKPASKTPISALLLAELIAETALPKGAVSILPMDREVGDKLVTDDRFKLLTFTGSPDVGWDMKTRAGKKKVVLELGGNAAVVVAPTANVEKMLPKLTSAVFGQSGQSCIHTQRLFVHESLKEKVVNHLIQEAQKLEYGDPLKDGVLFSSMIDAKNTERVNSWVVEAVSEGAKILYGGTRLGETGFMPTILTNTTKEMKVCSREAFAPVVVVESYINFKEVIAKVNDSNFGLQAGIFTNDLSEVNYAYEHLDVGGVIINNVSNYRIDHMPYGGVKDSGIGREGVRYAIEDMTELKVLVINKNV